MSCQFWGLNISMVPPAGDELGILFRDPEKFCVYHAVVLDSDGFGIYPVDGDIVI